MAFEALSPDQSQFTYAQVVMNGADLRKIVDPTKCQVYG